ncbi:hypothetical protein [Streptomyces sp. NPDC015414]|uniref:hypothetical protein n=1 Tax=Streptomyces sp. NPDC015414 TaxID=3364957 RepID=UPI0036F63B42
MALVAVEIVNNSDQTVRRMLDEDGEDLAYLKRMVRREDLKSVEVVKPAARKPAAK